METSLNKILKKTAEETVEIKERKIVKGPQISLTMISKYVIGSEARRKRILAGCKYPPNYIPRFYEMARKITCETFALNLKDQHEIYFEEFKRHSRRLREQAKGNPINKDAYKNPFFSAKGLDGIIGMEQLLTPILQKYVLEDNLSQRRNKIMKNGVRIGAMADIVLTDITASEVGFLKFNFASDKLKKEEAAIKLWVLHNYYANIGKNFDPKSCFLIDVAAWRIYTLSAVPSPEEQIDRATAEIFNLWSLI